MALKATVAGEQDAKRQSARDSRYQAQRLLWRRSSLKTVRACSRALVPDIGRASVMVTPTPDGPRAGLAGVMRCGSPWSCPVCSHKIAQGRAEEIAAAIRGWAAQGGTVAFLTLTMRHDRGDLLSDLWGALSYGWSKTTSGAAWADDQRRYGTPILEKSRVPWVRAVEATHGVNGWHLHVHAFLFLPAGMTEDALQGLAGSMFGRWSNALGRKGLRAPVARSVNGESVGVDAKFVDPTDDTRLSDYVTKATYDGAMLAAMEAARGQQKKGARYGNRTPFTMLASVVENLDNADDAGAQRLALRDLARWSEWEAGSRGRRQITWSQGLRAYLALGAAADDQDLVDDDATTEETIVTNVLSAEEWKVAQRDIPKLLREAEAFAAEFLFPMIASDPGFLARWSSSWDEFRSLDDNAVTFADRVRHASR